MNTKLYKNIIKIIKSISVFLCGKLKHYREFTLCFTLFDFIMKNRFNFILRERERERESFQIMYGLINSDMDVDTMWVFYYKLQICNI